MAIGGPAQMLKKLFFLVVLSLLVMSNITPALAQAGSIDWPEFVQWLMNSGVTDPYVLIDQLNSRSEKIDNQVGNWTVECAGQPAIVWTGMYVDDATLGGKAHKLLVDGKTGVYVIENGTKVPTPGGSICLRNFDGKIPSIGVIFTKTSIEVKALECMETSNVKGVIDAFSNINPDAVFSSLDTLVDNAPNSRLAAGGPGTVTTEAGMALIWTSGNVSNSIQMLGANGKKLFISSGGTMVVDHAFSGVALCNNLPLIGEVNTPAPTATQPAPGVDTPAPTAVQPQATAIQEYDLSPTAQAQQDPNLQPTIAVLQTQLAAAPVAASPTPTPTTIPIGLIGFDTWTRLAALVSWPTLYIGGSILLLAILGLILLLARRNSAPTQNVIIPPASGPTATQPTSQPPAGNQPPAQRPTATQPTSQPPASAQTMPLQGPEEEETSKKLDELLNSLKK